MMPVVTVVATGINRRRDIDEDNDGLNDSFSYSSFSLSFGFPTENLVEAGRKVTTFVDNLCFICRL